MKRKAKGQQGSWFANRRDTGELLPCIFKEYAHNWPHYHDPYHYDPSDPTKKEYVDAIKNGRVLLTSNELVGTRYDGANLWRRGNYIDEFVVANVTADKTGLRFDIVGRNKIG